MPFIVPIKKSNKENKQMTHAFFEDIEIKKDEKINFKKEKEKI